MKSRSNLANDLEASVGILTGSGLAVYNAITLSFNESISGIVGSIAAIGFIMGSLAYNLLSETYFPNFSITGSLRRAISPGIDYSNQVFFEKEHESKWTKKGKLERLATVNVTDLSERQTRKFVDYFAEEMKRAERGFKIVGFNGEDGQRFVDLYMNDREGYELRYNPPWNSDSGNMIRGKARKAGLDLPVKMLEETDSLLIERPY